MKWPSWIVSGPKKATPPIDQEFLPKIVMLERLGYVRSGVGMCWMGKNLHQASFFTNCRDFFIDSMSAFLCGEDYEFCKTEFPDIELDRLKILLNSAKLYPQTVSGVIRLINIYSVGLGFSPATITKCLLERRTKGDILGYLVSADAGWMRYPQPLSLMLLFIRLVCHHNLSIPEDADIHSINEFWAQLLEEMKCSTSTEEYRIRPNVYYLRHCYKYLPTIVEHYNEIFYKSFFDAWAEVSRGVYIYGMHSFITKSGTTSHKEERKIFTKCHGAEVRNERYEAQTDSGN